MSNESALWAEIKRLQQLIEDQKAEVPLVPRWHDWVPILDGFSADPTNCFYRYMLIGKICFLSIRQLTAGTSDANNFTISLPFTAATIANMAWGSPALFVVNGTLQTSPGAASILSGGSVINLYLNSGGGSWATSGNKAVGTLEIWYEVE